MLLKPRPTAAAGADAPSPPRESKRRAARIRRVQRIRRARLRVLASMLVLVILGVSLVAVGLAKVRGSTAGQYTDQSLQPKDPGFVALVSPTPTLLVLHKGADGQLAGAALLSLHSGDKGGAVIVLPAATGILFGDQPITLADSYREKSVNGAKSTAEQFLRLRVQEAVEVDDARWATLLGPVGPVPIRLDTAVGGWPAGSVEIAPADVGRFLAARVEGESELNRAERQTSFWDAWLDKVAGVAGQDAVPGEVRTGLGRFVRGLAAGPNDVSSLPAAPEPGLPPGIERFAVDGELATELLARSVPYPQSPGDGVRFQVRLLNGTTARDLNVRFARRLVEAGAEITFSGNAASFSEPTTRILYEDRRQKETATLLQGLLGIGVVEAAPTDEDAEPVDDAEKIDVTVILGADALEAIRR